MTREALLAEILGLPPEERIDLLGDAWGAIAATRSQVPVPEWHLEELEWRRAAPDPQDVSCEEVQERLKKSE